MSRILRNRITSNSLQVLLAVQCVVLSVVVLGADRSSLQVCALLKSPDKFDESVVRVHGFAKTDWHSSELFSDEQSTSGVAINIENKLFESNPTVKKFFVESFSSDHSIEVVVTGVFHKQGEDGPFIDLNSVEFVPGKD